MEKYEYLTKVFIINYKLGILPSWYPHPIPKYIQSIVIKFYDFYQLLNMAKYNIISILYQYFSYLFIAVERVKKYKILYLLNNNRDFQHSSFSIY